MQEPECALRRTAEDEQVLAHGDTDRLSILHPFLRNHKEGINISRILLEGMYSYTLPELLGLDLLVVETRKLILWTVILL